MEARDAKEASGETRSLQRAALLLRLLCSRTRVGWRLSDLAAESGLGVATVHRLLAGLITAELATRVPGTRHYTLGPLVYQAGLAAAPHFAIGEQAEPVLAPVARALGGTLFLKIRGGDESVCLARCEGERLVPALLLEPGGRRPLCQTAGGVAILLQLPRAEQRRIEQRHARRLQRRDPARWASIESMLARSREGGVALHQGDLAAGLCAVAVPVPLPPGVGPASLSLAIATPRLSDARVRRIVERLSPAAAVVAEQFARLRY